MIYRNFIINTEGEFVGPMEMEEGSGVVDNDNTQKLMRDLPSPKNDDNDDVENMPNPAFAPSSKLYACMGPPGTRSTLDPDRKQRH